MKSMKKVSNKSKIKLKDNLQDYFDWYINNYKTKYIPHTTNATLKKYFDNCDGNNFIYGSYNRLSAIQFFMWGLRIDTVNTICTIFKIRDVAENIDVIMAFGYSTLATNTNIGGSKFINSNFKWTYLTISGSHMSKDGEYRPCFLSSKNIEEICNDKCSDIITTISDYLKKAYIIRNFIISGEHFFPDDQYKEYENILEYHSYELYYKIASVSWFNYMYNISIHMTENNINAIYKKIMSKYETEDLIFFNILKAKYTTNMNIYRSIFNNIITLTVTCLSNVKIGQKIIPLSISEVQNPFDIQYNPWREYLISLNLSNLVVNNISPGFFMTNSWFYIKNAKKGLFDNEIQYEKMERSEFAEHIAKLLIKAKLYTHENMISNKQKKSNKQVNSWLNQKFKILSDKLQDPIEYAKEEIIMSNVALCFITEYVGRTLMDIIIICNKSQYYNNLIGNPFVESSHKIFNKYMFDICYNLYCMNSLSGLIHGDLHLNNVTVRAMTYKNVRDINDIKNPTVLYKIGESEQDNYIFPTVSYNMCIIDYSRTIILPEYIHKYRDTSLPKSYNIINNMNVFQDNQVEQLLQLYISYVPESSHNKDILKLLFKSNFEAVFKLLTVTDIYGLTQKLLKLFSIKNKDYIKPHNSCIKLITFINKTASTYLFEEMNKLISNNKYADIINKSVYPIYTIIKTCFSMHMIENISDFGNIIDIYNINNKIVYSLNTESSFPNIYSRIRKNKISKPKNGQLYSGSSKRKTCIKKLI